MINPRSFIEPVVGPLWLYFGRWLDKKGMAALAESCYRNGGATAGKSGAEAAFHLSQILLVSGRDDEAVTVCEQALRVDPRHARLWCALGAARRRLLELDAARDAYEKAVALDQGYAQAWNNLGEWHLIKGDASAALDKFEQALKFEPSLLQAMNNRAAALYELGHFGDAEDMARKAIAAYPDQAALRANLGNMLLHTGKARQAAKEYQKALECDQNCAEAQIGLSTLLGETHRLAETLAYLKNKISIKGESAQRLAMLALAQQAAGDRAAAEETCKKVLSQQPNNISAMITLAGCLSARGDHRGAIACNERALEANSDMPAIYSNVAFDATYLPDATAEEVFGYHREWAIRYEKTEKRQAFTFDRQREPDRPLRIGYVSGDFGRHPVGFLLRDVVSNHDHSQFSVTCYSMTRGSDEVTDAIRKNADVWVDALFMTDDELAEKIHEDRIDILVDLSGHTAYNRLPVFVRKPAPVQATWIGYFHSTGLETIDYFITDPHTTPATTSQLFSETPIWMPHTRFCYSPPEYATMVARAPVEANGTITFGSFNRVEKLVDPVVSAWVKVLNAVPGSRLLLKSGSLSDEAVCKSLRERFVAHGLEAERLEMRGPSSHPEMLAEYGDVDIALDPFPFNGGMTTLEALWMGVPVVALAGEGVVSRQSTSVLANIGLQELVFDSLTSYIEGAIALARDHDRLATLRRGMRARMSRSPLCLPDQFTQDLEALYRRMWQAWCRGEKLGMEAAESLPVARKTVLHVGCGKADIRSLPRLFHRRWQEIRLDINPDVAPDVVASMLDMSPIASTSVDAVFSSHNIEHLHPHEVSVALKEFRRVLKPDGVLVLTCPDLQSVCELVANDQLEEPAYISPAGPIAPIDILYGLRAAMAKGNLFMAHNTGFTARSLAGALADSGFETVEVKRGRDFDLWALAYSSEVAQERVEADKSLCFPEGARELDTAADKTYGAP